MISYSDLQLKKKEQEELKNEQERIRLLEESKKKFPFLDLIFVRHGESDGNIAGVCQGFTHGMLTSKGKIQATALGQALFYDSNNEPVVYDDIYCSDLNRVKETCSIALRSGKCNLDTISNVKYCELLREKNAGVYEGRNKNLIAKARLQHGNERTFRPRNGESWGDLMNRVMTFIDLLKKSYKPKPNKDPYRILIFTSGGVIKEFINAYIYGSINSEKEKNNKLWLASRRYYPNKAANGSIYIFKTISLDLFEMIVENFKPIDSSDCKITARDESHISVEDEKPVETSASAESNPNQDHINTI